MKIFTLLPLAMAFLLVLLPRQMEAGAFNKEALAQLMQQVIQEEAGRDQGYGYGGYGRNEEKEALEQGWADEMDATDATDAKAQGCFSRVAYTHWGKGSCPNAKDQVYSGVMVGSFYNQQGGNSNYLCLPSTELDFGDLKSEFASIPSADRIADIYGTEYEFPVNGQHDSNVPCSVCAVPGSSQLMIPGRTQCPPGMDREYYGYLMGETRIQNHARSEFICVDKDQDAVPGQSANTNGALIYQTALKCNGLGISPCPPHRPVSCVVCTL